MPSLISKGKTALYLILQFLKDPFNDIFSVKSYSQEGEDLVLKNLFAAQAKGFYVDIGAHHPKRFSNTYIFYRKGWHGLNVDATPGSMKKFRSARPRDINIEAAVSDRKELLTFYRFNEPALNCFSKELAEERLERNNKYWIEEEIEMETQPLREILHANMPKNTHIDFMSVDVEGHDLNVLKSNDWESFMPSVILVEEVGASLLDIRNSEINTYLSKLGYDLFAKMVNTLIFCHNEFMRTRTP